MKKVILTLMLLLILNIGVVQAKPIFVFNAPAKSFSLSFDSTGIGGTQLDWFLVLVVAYQIFYLNSAMIWQMASSYSEVEPASQMNAFTFQDFHVPIPIPDGCYVDGTAYFAVDFIPNGEVDWGSLVYDSIPIQHQY